MRDIKGRESQGDHGKNKIMRRILSLLLLIAPLPIAVAPVPDNHPDMLLRKLPPKEAKAKLVYWTLKRDRFAEQKKIDTERINRILKENYELFQKNRKQEADKVFLSLSFDERHYVYLHFQVSNAKQIIRRENALKSILTREKRSGTPYFLDERKVNVPANRVRLAMFNELTQSGRYAEAIDYGMRYFPQDAFRYDNLNRPIPMQFKKFGHPHLWSLKYYPERLPPRSIKDLSKRQPKKGLDINQETVEVYNRLIDEEEFESAERFARENLNLELPSFDNSGPAAKILSIERERPDPVLDPLLNGFPGIKDEIPRISLTSEQEMEAYQKAEENAINNRVIKYNNLILSENYEEALHFGRNMLPEYLVEVNSDNQPLLILNLSIDRENDTVSISANIAQDNSGFGWNKVTDVFERETDELYEITAEGLKGPIKGTGEHPVMIIEHGWVEIRNLKVGMKGVNAHGQPADITGVKKIKLDYPVKVYNFRVEGAHTYFVGRGNGLLVHNANYEHNPKKEIIDKPIPDRRTPYGIARTYGQTRPNYDNIKFEVTRNSDGSYGVRVKKWIVITQVEINSEARWNDISEFKRFYKPSGIYTIQDYDASFNTRDGTIYHERRHQDDMTRELALAKPYMERNIGKIEEGSPEAAIAVARRMKDSFARQINGNIFSSARHNYVKLQEWKYYHRKYEEFKQKR